MIFGLGEMKKKMFSKLENLWWRIQTFWPITRHLKPRKKGIPSHPHKNPQIPSPASLTPARRTLTLEAQTTKKVKKMPNLLEKSLSTHIALITNPPRENSPFPISRSPCPPIRHRTPSTEPLHRKPTAAPQPVAFCLCIAAMGPFPFVA